jgi:AcrR family transcriptional regulator
MREPVKGRTAAGRRREQRARATRDRIVAAATSLFVEQGYAATTVDAIATAAGVATATVYQAFGTKAAVLSTALDQSVVGDAEEVPLLERDWVTDARQEPDPEKRLAIVVTNAATVAARTAALKEVMRDAAATEPAIRDLLDRDDARRLRTQYELVRIAIGDGSPSEGDVAAFYQLVNSRSYLLATRQLGWSEARWCHWLIEMLSKQLRRR